MYTYLQVVFSARCIWTLRGSEKRGGKKSQGYLRSIKEQLRATCHCSVPTALLHSNCRKTQRSGFSACLPASAFPAALDLAFNDDDELTYFWEMSGENLSNDGKQYQWREPEGVLVFFLFSFFLSGNCIVYAVIMENDWKKFYCVQSFIG